MYLHGLPFEAGKKENNQTTRSPPKNSEMDAKISFVVNLGMMIFFFCWDERCVNAKVRKRLRTRPIRAASDWRKHPPLLLVQMLVPSEAIKQPLGTVPSALQFSCVWTRGKNEKIRLGEGYRYCCLPTSANIRKNACSQHENVECVHACARGVDAGLMQQIQGCSEWDERAEEAN